MPGMGNYAPMVSSIGEEYSRRLETMRQVCSPHTPQS